MKIKELLASAIALFMINVGTSQIDMRDMMTANKKFKKKEYSLAREIYLKMANQGYKSDELLKNLGDTYFLSGDLENALEWYAELITTYSDYSDEYLFKYAQCLKRLELYKEAYDVMRKYYYRIGKDPSLLFKRPVKEYLDIIQLQSNRFELQNFDHNSSKHDFSPQIGVANNLVFASERNPVLTNSMDKNMHLGIDLYTLSNGGIGKLKKDKNKMYNEFSPSLNKTKDTLYFTRTRRGNKHITPFYQESSNIYRTVFKNGRWSSSKKVNLKLDSDSYVHPALSPDGKKLYFSCVSKKTNSKYDLYIVDIKKNGKLGVPRPLGNKINTLGDEIFPFIAKNGDLYFASNGHFGLGGFDIFISKLKNGVHQEPYNLGTPVNSVYDDISFIYDEFLNEGYFSSNRNNEGVDLDIYKCKNLKPLVTGCNRKLTGSVVFNENPQETEGCFVELLDDEYQKIDATITDQNGFYEFDVGCSRIYFVRIKKTSFNSIEEMFYVDKEYNKELKVATLLRKGDKVIKNWSIEGNNLNELLGLATIYFDSNKTKIRTEAGLELKKVIKLLRNNPELKIHIRAHTDNKGNPRHNKNLSQKRALETKMYIVENGNIREDRIIAEGFGATLPKINCKEDCSEVQHQKNRRSEFVVYR